MANNYSIVVVEDEKGIRNVMKMVFEANGYKVHCAENGSEAMMSITSLCPDIVILDLGLPDMDGVDIIRNVRQWSDVPIIVISARSQERDKVNALELGADDYITKPFGTSEMLARVKNAIKHAVSVKMLPNQMAQTDFTLGEMTVDFKKKRVLIGGNDMHLTQNEYKIVALLAQNAGKILTYDYIIKHIWGPNLQSDNRILRVNMANIRRKIEKDTANPEYIATEIGVGYRMNTE